MKELKLQATLENLPRVLAFVTEGLAGLEAEPEKRYQLEVAVEEVFSNIAFYAYGPETGPVAIALEADPETSRAVIRFADFGKAYDPLAKPDPNLKLSLRERRRGGFGIYIVKKQMDRTDYAYSEGRNVLTIEKTLR